MEGEQRARRTGKTPKSITVCYRWGRSGLEPCEDREDDAALNDGEKQMFPGRRPREEAGASKHGTRALRGERP